MPPKARLRLAAVSHLERQLEFAPSAALRRIARAAESLTRTIHGDQLFSEAWLVEHVTRFKSRDADTTKSLVGKALAMDLSALALRLSERAPLRADDLPGGAVVLKDAAQSLGVSERSLQRWKRQGLAMVRIASHGGSRTAVSGDAVAWCRKTLLPHARSNDRDPHRHARMLACAANLAKPGESLHALARRVVAETGGSIATARRVVALAERRGTISRMGRRTAVRPHLRETAWRAWRRGLGLADISQAVSRSDSATMRLVRRERRDRLRKVRMKVEPLASFAKDQNGILSLEPKSVRSGLSCEVWPAEGQAFLKRFFPSQLDTDRPRAADAQRVVALRWLVWKTGRDLVALNGSDPGEQLDVIETRLRWAARIRLSLIERALPGALSRLQAMHGGPLSSLPPVSLRRALAAAVAASCHVVDAAMVGSQVMERLRLTSLAAKAVEQAVTGAAWLSSPRNHDETVVAISTTWRERSVPWCHVIPLRDDVAAAACASDLPGARLLVLRFGWDGCAPHTAKEAAATVALDSRQAAQLAAKAFRSLRRVVAANE